MLKASNREAKAKGLRRGTTKSSEKEELTSNREAKGKGFGRKTTKSSETELTSMLNKFNKSDIISNFIEKQSNKQHTTITKQNIIKEAINLLTEKFSDLDELILFLHLRHIFTNKKTRRWTGFEIKEAKRLSNSYLPSLTSDKISYSLLRYFTKYDIPCKVYIEKKGNGCIWIVMYLGNEKPQRPVYMVAHTKSSTVFVTAMTKQNLEIFQKVIRKTFRGSDIEQISLIQENADFFQKLNLKKKLQKTKSKENCQTELPAKKKSRLEKSNSSENDEVLEDLPRKRKAPQQNSKNLELPKIGSLQYYVTSSAFCEDQRNNKFYSVFGIKFKGAHVLKGLKHLVDSGIADGPLPDFLLNEPRCGKTYFEINDV